MTKEEVREYIKKEIGFPVVQVELLLEHLDQAIDNALRIFNHWMCDTNVRVAYERSESVVIQLEEGVRGVVAVQFLFPESERQTARINIFEIIYRMVFPRFPISDWYLYRSFYDMFQQVRGTEPDWRYDSVNRVLYVDCWSGPYDIAYLVVRDVDLDSFEESKSNYEQEFLDLAVARVKQMIAPVRGKFGNIPAPGGLLTTDANMMKEQGEKKEAEVREFLKNQSRFYCVGIIG